jgi:polyisoprenyl-phosphate glycosyltransferase
MDSTRKPTIAAVIPAYNEERNIRRTIHVLHHIDLLDEIIVVNDGSVDRTAEIVAEEPGVTLVNVRENVGKGGAVKVGLKHTRADIILLLDADLIGLRREHVTALLDPVISGRAAASLGVFRHGKPITDMAQRLAPGLSGQRAIRREILCAIDIEHSRYGIEVVINKHLEDNEIETAEVELHNLTHSTKEQKMGLLKGLGARARMYYEVARILLGADVNK